MKRGRDGEVLDGNEVLPTSSNESKDADMNDMDVEVTAVLRRPEAQVKCPYLDTVCRSKLDFDSEKLCSQTLTNRNVYVCLVCGKYFEGRGKHTPAYTHSLQCNHYVFMNLESGRCYCLPDGYEVLDQSLGDIQRCLSPSFSPKEIAALDRNASLVRDMHGTSYLPGFVGLNNLNATDDLSVVLHMLSHIAPLRDFFLQPTLFSGVRSRLVQEFALVIRKLWSSHNFKSTVSPQELAQIMSVESKRKFTIGNRCDVLDMFLWLLATLQRQLDPKAKPSPKSPSVVYEPFQGIIEVTTMTKKLVDNFEEQKFLEKAQDKIVQQAMQTTDGWVTSTHEVPFTFLSLDIPPCPLFRDSHGGLVIPQVPLFQLLKKYDGETWVDQITNDAHLRKRFRIKKLPRYLVLQLSRFTKNNFSLEKNPTIVTFPVRNLEMKHYLGSAQDNPYIQEMQQQISRCPAVSELAAMTIDQLRETITSLGSALHRQELLALEQQPPQSLRDDMLCIAQRVVERVLLFRSTKYDLVANICHESEVAGNGIDVGDNNSGELFQKVRKSTAVAASVTQVHASDDVFNRGTYKIHLPLKSSSQQWFEMLDLHVSETTPQQIGVSESYILVYEKKDRREKDKEKTNDKEKPNAGEK